MTTQSLKEDGRPAQQWYWDDWFSAFDARLCSLAVRGLWIDMLGIMFKAEIRGTLTINGKQMSNKSLAKVAGETEQNINKYIEELEDNDVFSRLDDGTIICRRMFNESKRKEQISKIRAKAGKKGAEERWQKNGNEEVKDMTKMATSIPASSPISASTSNTCPKKEFSDIDIKLTNLLIKLILKNNPKSKVKNMTQITKDKWINECRLLRSMPGGWPPEDIRKIIIWCQCDSFWKTNILSMPKLREQIDQLALKCRGEIEKTSHLRIGERE